MRDFWWWWPWHRKPRKQISLLVPYRKDHLSPDREDIWHWLKLYWRSHLPDAEIVMGRDRSSHVFSKARAVNDAARRAHGDIFVILDSDTYFSADVIQECARNIRIARRRRERLWYIPYRHIYRLTKGASRRLLDSSPFHPLRFPSPPHPSDVESTLGSLHGHRFGAMIQIMPRRAFELVGGMDERFEDWGGEDVSFVRALDTLYGQHQTTDNDVLHIWHTKIGHTHDERMWEGGAPGHNNQLASRFNMATGDPKRMRALVKEGQAGRAAVQEHNRRVLIGAGSVLLIVTGLVMLKLGGAL